MLCGVSSQNVNLFLRNRSIEVFLGIARADEPENQRDYANTGQAEERPPTGFADVMQAAEHQRPPRDQHREGIGTAENPKDP